LANELIKIYNKAEISLFCRMMMFLTKSISDVHGTVSVFLFLILF